MTVVLLPIVLKRDLSALAHFNLLGIISIMYTILLVMGETPEYMEHYFNIEEVTWVRFTINAFQGYALSVFAYACHTNVFIIHTELKNAIDRRMKKVRPTRPALHQPFSNTHRSSAEQFSETSPFTSLQR